MAIKSISKRVRLTDTTALALKQLADQLSEGNESDLIRRLVTDRAREEWGKDWMQHLQREDDRRRMKERELELDRMLS